MFFHSALRFVILAAIVFVVLLWAWQIVHVLLPLVLLVGLSYLALRMTVGGRRY
jgi:hypothetical protein